MRFLSTFLAVLSLFSIVHAQDASTAKNVKETEKMMEQVKAMSKNQVDMLKSLLLANSQQIFGVNNLQKTVTDMQNSVATFEEQKKKCEAKLADLKSEEASANQSGFEATQSDSLSLLELSKQKRSLMDQRKTMLIQLARHQKTHKALFGEESEEKAVSLLQMKKHHKKHHGHKKHHKKHHHKKHHKKKLLKTEDSETSSATEKTEKKHHKKHHHKKHHHKKTPVDEAPYKVDDESDHSEADQEINLAEAGRLGDTPDDDETVALLQSQIQFDANQVDTI